MARSAKEGYKANRTVLKTDQKNVAVSGTAETLPTIPIGDDMALVIKAKHTNTGRIRIGGTKADAESATVSFSLGANEKATVFMEDGALVWIDATVSGEGVELLVERR